MVDLVTALAAGAGGALAGVAVAYFVFFGRPRKAQAEVLVREPDGSLRSSSVTQTQLERSRREMRTMMVERDLLSSALMKVYEAETEGRITKEEREMIAKRYADQLKEVQGKMKDVELVVEVGELEKLREELVSLFQEKIQNIEARLDQAKERLGAVAPLAVKKEPVARIERKPELEKVVEKKAKPEISESERRVKEIRNEVMEALTRLEQIDIEKKQQQET
ncbi:MAG: hypothetical protein LYZ69_04555 [Nitrososphaerales archaeon]|nr:hypothetical protein [Nitrososphaerales archaeon]